MSRLKGSHNKKSHPGSIPSSPEVKRKQEEPVHEETQAEEAKEELVLTPVQPPPALAEPDLPPLQPGQKYFEAPDGTVLIGEETTQQMWYRKLNNGKGGWINPRRTGTNRS